MPWFFRYISKESIAAHRTSVTALIAANALLLVGVLFFSWSIFEIVLLYWFENVVLGVINLLKMIACSPDPDQIDLTRLLKEKVDAKTRLAVEKAGSLETNRWVKHSAKFFFVPFFAFHYGMFCFVHGIFVVTLLGGGGPFAQINGVQVQSLSIQILVAALALTASHLISFFVNYLGKSEYRRTVLPVLMFQPYGRIIVLHVAIVLGAFATIMLGSSILLLMIFIVGKTVLDLNLHLREHQSKEGASNEKPMLTTV